jgi:hypothetical protein
MGREYGYVSWLVDLENDIINARCQSSSERQNVILSGGHCECFVKSL